jgi:hypothetical protein
VTKAWLRQAVLGLVLLCHSSYRGVIEFLRDLLDTRLCIGTVHNIVQAAVPRAQPINAAQDWSCARASTHDELFQASWRASISIRSIATCSLWSATAMLKLGPFICWT